jgi:hypothetical protein
LGSLITKKSSVFEAAVSLHGSNLVARLKARSHSYRSLSRAYIGNNDYQPARHCSRLLLRFDVPMGLPDFSLD